MKYFVYIIKSEKDQKNYIGSTADVIRRLEWHNNGKNTSTKYRRPFQLLKFWKFNDKSSALKYEKWLKKQKGGFKIKKLLEII